LFVGTAHAIVKNATWADDANCARPAVRTQKKQRILMSTPLPMTHDCCWARSGTSDSSPHSDLLTAIPRGAATVWRAFARWQIRKLERRIAAIEPNCRWLH
jgi:hypothetical protein